MADAAPTRISVSAGAHGSTILIGSGVSNRLAALFDEHGIGSRRVIVSNTRVWSLHGERFKSLSEAEPILLPDGERFKTLRAVSTIYDALIAARVDRGTTLIAIGGGVVGDTAGFAAASYLRGISLVHVPTTLLAQVDSAIGGKVGVNHRLGKNLIGAFYQPRLVAADPDLLATLSQREFRCGLYEVVKYGMIASSEMFARLATTTDRVLARDPAVLESSIVDSVRIKADVVSRDERESGLRRILNFGHTVAHALEAVTNYRRFKHGEAVAHGMIAAASLSAQRGLLRSAERDALVVLLRALGALPRISDLSISAVLESVGRDKKVVDGRLHFVLATAIGATTTVDDVTHNELRDVLGSMGLVH